MAWLTSFRLSISRTSPTAGLTAGNDRPPPSSATICCIRASTPKTAALSRLTSDGSTLIQRDVAATWRRSRATNSHSRSPSEPSTTRWTYGDSGSPPAAPLQRAPDDCLRRPWRRRSFDVRRLVLPSWGAALQAVAGVWDDGQCQMSGSRMPLPGVAANRCEVWGSSSTGAHREVGDDTHRHHVEVVSLKGDSYRLKDRDLGRVPTDDTA